MPSENRTEAKFRPENTVIHYYGGADEGASGNEDRATEFAALIEMLEEMAPEQRFSLRPDGVATTASADYACELLKRSRLDREASTWYVAAATPEGSNLPPFPATT